MNVIFSGYKGISVNEVDDEIYIRRILSACLVIEEKQYDRINKKLVNAPKGFCVTDLMDGEFVNFKR
ncbi:hypothetical protein [Clostridium sp.]|uniref:hypothetical protein n=1 Tax=Clostridium sp. TaxID=1506 RepID=UPI0026296D50|nr:hypothetical protein [uncultured Clostridium sp.]